ncbi:hypothetical protein HanIR_Chr10g0488721 [Helianthus annuus]|nr:hypothetical protein HanIR_Chr10g0488721 [Helianthus annuus]
MHIPRVPSLDKEHRTNSVLFYFIWSLFYYIFVVVYLNHVCRLRMPPRFLRGRDKGPVTGHDHEAGPSHRHTPSITMSTSPQEPWRVYVEPGRRSVSLSSSPSYLHFFGPQSENEPDHPPPSFIPLQRSNSHHSFGDPTFAFQSRFNPANFIQRTHGF